MLSFLIWEILHTLKAENYFFRATLPFFHADVIGPISRTKKKISSKRYCYVKVLKFISRFIFALAGELQVPWSIFYFKYVFCANSFLQSTEK